jgi:hypothetical protein
MPIIWLIYLAFETYLFELMRRYNTDKYPIYYLIHDEGVIPVQGNVASIDSVLSRLRDTLGNLPNRLPSDLKGKVKMGYHWVSILDRNRPGYWDQKVPIRADMSPVNPAARFDFISIPAYEGGSTPEIYITQMAALHPQVFNLFPGIPKFYGEFGSTLVNRVPGGGLEFTTTYVCPKEGTAKMAENEQIQAHGLALMAQYAEEHDTGMNVWDWNPIPPEDSECFFGAHAITRQDGTLRPATDALKAAFTPKITSGGVSSDFNPFAISLLGQNFSRTDYAVITDLSGNPYTYKDPNTCQERTDVPIIIAPDYTWMSFQLSTNTPFNCNVGKSCALRAIITDRNNGLTSTPFTITYPAQSAPDNRNAECTPTTSPTPTPSAIQAVGQTTLTVSSTNITQGQGPVSVVWSNIPNPQISDTVRLYKKTDLTNAVYYFRNNTCNPDNTPTKDAAKAEGSCSVETKNLPVGDYQFQLALNGDDWTHPVKTVDMTISGTKSSGINLTASSSCQNGKPVFSLDFSPGGSDLTIGSSPELFPNGQLPGTLSLRPLMIRGINNNASTALAFDTKYELWIKSASQGDSNHVSVTTPKSCFGVANDFDGDGKADLTVFRTGMSPGQNNWFIKPSSGGQEKATSWGAGNDYLNAPADYDGDKITDLAVFRKSDQMWFIIQSQSGVVRQEQFGQLGDLPEPGDFDGDGKADLAIFRPNQSPGQNNWFIRYSTGKGDLYISWGASADFLPALGDYDKDHKTDLTVFRKSDQTWYIIQSSNGQVKQTHFGQGSSDIPVPADYDGDGKTDLAVFKPNLSPGQNNWFIDPSAGGSDITSSWGASSDYLPVPGDFDGDGKADLTVFRKSDQTWFIIQSTNNQVRQEHYGFASTDIPL